MSSSPIPTDPAEKQELKTMLVEITNSMRRMDDEREHIGDIAKEAEDKFGVKKKVVRKLASTMYKHNYADIQAEHEHFEELYETLVEGKTSN